MTKEKLLEKAGFLVAPLQEFNGRLLLDREGLIEWMVIFHQLQSIEPQDPCIQKTSSCKQKVKFINTLASNHNQQVSTISDHEQVINDFIVGRKVTSITYTFEQGTGYPGASYFRSTIMYYDSEA